jgi:hypothetical protein
MFPDGARNWKLVTSACAGAAKPRIAAAAAAVTAIDAKFVALPRHRIDVGMSSSFQWWRAQGCGSGLGEFLASGEVRRAVK